MQAAVVESFDRPPRYGQFEEPEAGDGEVIVSVAASALSNLVKAQASGKHYSSGKQLPLVPGVDGVGRGPDGKRVFFFGPRAPFGAMAERVPVRKDWVLPLPGGIDDVTAAALPNPAMASWAALQVRAKLQAGETVLINGATGVSGQQAVQVAKYMGARRVIATGRNPQSLEKVKSLGADAVISLEQPEEELKKAFRAALLEDGGAQVVLDYVWGRPAELLLESLKGGGKLEGAPRVRFVQIGSVAGPTIQLSAEWLRSSGLEMLGSGLGSTPIAGILESMRAMFEAYDKAGFRIETKAVPLADAEKAWTETESGERTVFTI